THSCVLSSRFQPEQFLGRKPSQLRNPLVLWTARLGARGEIALSPLSAASCPWSVACGGRVAPGVYLDTAGPAAEFGEIRGRVRARGQPTTDHGHTHGPDQHLWRLDDGRLPARGLGPEEDRRPGRGVGARAGPAPPVVARAV